MTAGLVLALGLALGAEDSFVGSDKALHFSVSVGLSGAAYTAAALLHQPAEVKLSAAIGLSLFAGVAKELADARGFGTPSPYDLAWDVLGTVTGTAIAWLLDWWITK